MSGHMVSVLTCMHVCSVHIIQFAAQSLSFFLLHCHCKKLMKSIQFTLCSLKLILSRQQSTKTLDAKLQAGLSYNQCNWVWEEFQFIVVVSLSLCFFV